MRKYKTRAIAGLLCAMMAVSACTGCSNGLSKETESGKETTASQDDTKSYEKVTIDKDTLRSEKIMTSFDEDIYLNEIFLFSLDIMENSSTQPSNSYAITDEEAAALKAEIESETKRYKIEYHIALDKGYTLTDSDKEGVNKLISSFKGKYSQAFLDKLCIDDALIEKVYTERAYVLKKEQEEKNRLGETELASQTDANKDKNFVSLYYMVFPCVEADENGEPKTDENGNYIPISDDEKAKVEEKANKLVAEVREKGTDPETLAEEYGIKASSQNMNGYVGAYSEHINEVVKDMKTGEITDPEDSSLGYIVIYMQQDHDEELKELYVKKLADEYVKTEIEKIKSSWTADQAYVEKVEFSGDFWKSFDLRNLVEFMMN